MKSKFLDILCIIIAAILFISSVGVVADAKRDKPEKEEKSPKKPWVGGGAKKDNLEPTVIILEPTETYVSGDFMVIAVSVVDEDLNPIPAIYVDTLPTFNTGNVVVVDISGWVLDSEHIITAAYMDSGGKTGGDDLLVIKSDLL